MGGIVIRSWTVPDFPVTLEAKLYRYQHLCSDNGLFAYAPPPLMPVGCAL
jgi:hypothetical protein